MDYKFTYSGLFSYYLELFPIVNITIVYLDDQFISKQSLSFVHVGLNYIPITIHM